MPTPRAGTLRWPICFALAAALFAVLSACSDDGGRDGASRTTTTRATVTTTTVRSSTTSTTTATSTAPGSTTDPTPTTLASLPDTDEGYADALRAGYEASGDAADLTPDDVDCMAESMVRIVGVDAFREAGVTADQVRSGEADLSSLTLTDTQARAVVEAYHDCDIDLVALYRQGLALDDVTDTQRECVDDLLTPELIEELLVGQLTGSNAGEDEMEKVSDCVS